MRNRHPKITHKWYFWMALGVPLGLAILTFAATLHSESFCFAFTKSAFEQLVTTFQMTLSLLALGFVTTGAAFAYYRLDLGHTQNERQIANQDETNYQQFRSEFLQVMKESGYEFKVLDIAPSVIFSSLYPRRADGKIQIIEDFETFISDDDPLDFLHVMRNGIEKSGPQKSDPYCADTYMGAYSLFAQLRNFLPIDADVNFNLMDGALFAGKFSEDVTGTFQDVLHIVTVVNLVSGGKYLDNNERRRWRKWIDRLPVIAEATTIIHRIMEEEKWIPTIMQGQYSQQGYDEFLGMSIRGELQKFQDKGCDSDGARKYIFECFAGDRLRLNEEALKLVAEKLGIPYEPPKRFRNAEVA